MEVKVVLKKGNAVVVSYEDPSGTVRTVILNSTITDNVRVGQVLDVSEDVISTGTEYGIDWDVLMPGGFTVSSRDVQNALANRGVYTMQDIRENPGLVRDAINVLVRRLQVKISKSVKNIGG